MKVRLLMLVFVITIACEHDEANQPVSWRKLSPFPGEGRVFGVGFSLQGRGYWAFGLKSQGPAPEVWAYDPAEYSWEQMQDFPFEKDFPFGIDAVTAAVVNDRAYVLMNSSRLYEYNPLKDEWKLVSTFPLGSTCYLVSFGLGDNVYFGTGTVPDDKVGSVRTRAFWKYSTTQRNWTQIEDLPGAARLDAISFVIGNKAYVGGGNEGSNVQGFTDLYRYDDDHQTWQAVADLPDKSMIGLHFSNASRGYVGILHENEMTNTHLYEYNPDLDRWSRLCKFPSGQSLYATSFSLGRRVIIVGGDLDPYREVWEFIP